MNDQKPGETPSLLSDIRIIFATILTDPGSSLAYGADALIAVTIVLIQTNYMLGLTATLVAGGIVMTVYLIAILVYNSMTKHHTHKVLGGGAFVSALITSTNIRNHPKIKKFVELLGKTGTASLLADFPATQAISLIAGVEALYFIPVQDRLKYALGFLVFISFVQKYGLGNLAKFMIWPVIAFYTTNLCINAFGIYTIFQEGWHEPVISHDSVSTDLFWPLVFGAVANGATLITGVEVGYSSINIPHHKGKAIRASMWILFGIVICTYTMQIINFLGLGVAYDHHLPVPIMIAKHLGGDSIATPFGLLTAVMLLLAAQTAQSDFPLEILRASRSNFFPRGLGDMAWKKTTRPPVIGGHSGVYNPRATLLLGALTIVILVFFPSSHAIEGMYGLAVVIAMNIDISAYLLRQVRTRKISWITILAQLIMLFMLGNILYNKFLEGAWFILVLMTVYLVVFLVSAAIYSIWLEKLNVVPMNIVLWYPAFQDKIIDRSNVVLVSKFHPGVLHFLKNYIKSGHIPLVLHFQTDASEEKLTETPEWYLNIPVESSTDTISAITQWIKQNKPNRVHLIPFLVKGVDFLGKHYFGNSIERLKFAVSQHADLQVEYNRERVEITWREIVVRTLPGLERFLGKPALASKIQR